MGEDVGKLVRMLALILGSLAVLLGLAAFLLDLVQGEGFSAMPLVAVALGLLGIASTRKRSRGPLR